jgi:hypothetical protein
MDPPDDHSTADAFRGIPDDGKIVRRKPFT